MPNNQIGSAEIITFRTSRRDSIYKYPLEGVFVGSSVSHVALKLTFNNQALYQKYVAGNPNIHALDNLVNLETGEKMYSVYFSFWPQTNLYMPSDKSYLASYKHDCEQSALGSPMTYSSNLGAYVGQDRSIVSTMIPILKYFVKTELDLPPSIILHTTRLRGVLEHSIAQNTPDRQLVVDSIINTAIDYTTKYEAWSDALLVRSNLLQASHTRRQLKGATNQIHLTNLELTEASNKLRELIRTTLYVNQEFTDEHFYASMEQFITFGRPEVDSETLPLVIDPSKSFGLGLEVMLRYIQDVANNPDKYEYDLFAQSCATMVLNILELGAKNSYDSTLRSAFIAPWYVRWFNVPVSPAMVIQQAADVEQITGDTYHNPTVKTCARTPMQQQRRPKINWVGNECSPVITWLCCRPAANSYDPEKKPGMAMKIN